MCFDGSGICLLGFGSLGLIEVFRLSRDCSPTYTHYLGWNKKHVN